MTAREKAYVLPAPDAELLACALEAYRLAMQYSRRMYLKWQPRSAELRRKDEFHPTRCAWENDDYRGDQIVKAARDAMLTIACGSKKLPGVDPMDIKMFNDCKNRDFVRAASALNTVYRIARGEVRPPA